MNKYILPNNNAARLLKVDTETEDIDIINYASSDINWIYIVPEDGEFKNAKTGKTTKVKKYDIIIQFYTTDFTTTDAIVIHNKEWSTRIKEIEKRAYDVEKEMSRPKCECECDCGQDMCCPG